MSKNWLFKSITHVWQWASDQELNFQCFPVTQFNSLIPILQIPYIEAYTKLPNTMAGLYFSLLFARYSHLLLSFNNAFPLACPTYLFQYTLGQQW